MSTQKPSNHGTNWSMGAALGAAVAASACCTIPLALVSLGIGGAWIGSLTALEPYRWLFVAMAVLALVVSPWLVAPSPSAAIQQASATMTDAEQSATSSSTTPASFQQIVLVVEGMTCDACPATVRKALEGVEGVYSARATYEPPQAVVRFDPAKVSVDDLIQATTNAGYPSHPKTSL